MEEQKKNEKGRQLRVKCSYIMSFDVIYVACCLLLLLIVCVVCMQQHISNKQSSTCSNYDFMFFPNVFLCLLLVLLSMLTQYMQKVAKNQ